MPKAQQNARICAFLIKEPTETQRACYCRKPNKEEFILLFFFFAVVVSDYLRPGPKLIQKVFDKF
jgi:hypothetical protein